MKATNPVNFGNLLVGQTAFADITVTNVSNAPITVNGGCTTACSPFASNDSNCDFAVLAPGGSCTTSWRFTPTAVGRYTRQVEWTETPGSDFALTTLAGAAK